jgi:hypothetical protein
MKHYNLTQKQFQWLLDLSSKKSVDLMASYELRESAYTILKKCGYNRKYSEDDRTVLLHLREMYINEKKNYMLDDLPF